MTGSETIENKIHWLHGAGEAWDGEQANKSSEELQQRGSELIHRLMEGDMTPEEMEAAEDELIKEMLASGVSEITIDMPVDASDIEGGKNLAFENLERANFTFESETDDFEEPDIEYVDFEDTLDCVAAIAYEFSNIVGDYRKDWLEGNLEAEVPEWACILLQGEEQVVKMMNWMVEFECTPSMSVFCQLVPRIQIVEHFASEVMLVPTFPREKIEDVNRILFYVWECEELLGCL